ncbi:hypothetical protein EHYA_07504 [Embleya hyalina]|uniref:Uncharacterized protein n=1 Tax=Embleya hyalina TaxID=516124 RepID=A0A401YYS5_9ACTN|nr:hypothetical protein EHYA_07504 [Embleya hyalina]
MRWHLRRIRRAPVRSDGRAALPYIRAYARM